jgi:hypothetical protein
MDSIALKGYRVPAGGSLTTSVLQGLDQVCGVSELCHRRRPGLLRDALVLVEKAAEDATTPDLSLGETGDGAVGTWRLKPAATLGRRPSERAAYSLKTVRNCRSRRSG